MAIGIDRVSLLNPPQFKITKVVDFEQILQDWSRYRTQFKQFLSVTKGDGIHTEGHIHCSRYSVAKNMLLMMGQDKLKSFWDHVGKIQENNSFKDAVKWGIWCSNKWYSKHK